MARIEPIPIEQAEGGARELLGELIERGGEPGPMVRAMANAPALLRGYIDLTRAMKRSRSLSAVGSATASNGAPSPAGCRPDTPRGRIALKP